MRLARHELALAVHVGGGEVGVGFRLRQLGVGGVDRGRDLRRHERDRLLGFRDLALERGDRELLLPASRGGVAIVDADQHVVVDDRVTLADWYLEHAAGDLAPHDALLALDESR